MKALRDNSKLGKLLLFTFSAYLIYQTLVLVAITFEGLLIHRIINGKEYDEYEVEFSDTIISIINYGDYLFVFSASIIFICWMYRAYKNVAELNKLIQFTPTLAIWGWIIPFANFFIPYQIMKEMNMEFTKVLIKEEDKTKYSLPVVLLISWWFFYLTRGTLARLSSAVSSRLTDNEEYMSLVYWEFSINFFSLIAVVLTLIFLKKMIALEQEAYKNVQMTTENSEPEKEFQLIN